MITATGETLQDIIRNLGLYKPSPFISINPINPSYKAGDFDDRNARSYLVTVSGRTPMEFDTVAKTIAYLSKILSERDAALEKQIRESRKAIIKHKKQGRT